MAEKKIDINAKQVDSKVSTKEYKTSVSIKDIAAKINKEKQYQTGKFDTKLKVTVTGLGEEAIPNDADFKRFNDSSSQEDFTLLNPIKNVLEVIGNIDESLIFVMNHVRVFTETLQPLETISIDSFKPLLTNYNAFDTFSSATAYKRFFTSGAVCTDDYCQICPDDDQTATFTKVVKDDYSIQETISKFYSTSRTDQAVNNDFLSLLLSKILLTQFSQTDESHRDILKVNNENLNSTEIVQKDYGLNKLNSAGEFTELFVKLINTNYNSQIQDSFDEIQKIDFNKRLLSEKESTVFDSVTKVWEASRFLSSTFSYNDIITNKNVNKGLETSFTSVDIETILSGKTLLTSNNLVEDTLDPNSNFFRLFTDHVDATDDFNEVELDDDQTATFTKVLKDNSESSELILFNTSTVYNDLSLTSEEISNLSFKVLSSDFTSNDFPIINLDKSLFDSFTNFDQPVFNLTYNLNTITDPEDQINFDLSYNILTQYLGIESISNSPQKVLSSESNALEELLTDLFTLRILEDENQASDSGLINNQNYFAEAYVEPGYVGTNRTI
jgi:hypothetical protein